MHHALYLAPFGDLAEPVCLVDLARAAEERGWDGLFLWDHVWRSEVRNALVADPWIALAAIAAVTERMRLGPMVVPLARRRPQKVARETVTLDRLSGGRLTVGVGLGVDTGGELARFGELVDDRRRGDALDEAVQLIRALWTGAKVEHRGDRYQADGVAFLPTPSQQPRIPLWGAARGSSGGRPLRRAAALDGLFPVSCTLPQLDRMLESVATQRGGLDGYDVAFVTGPDATVDQCAARGVTWALSALPDGSSLAAARALVEAGPPG